MGRPVLFSAVFLASAATLVLEIVAGRILAPYVGVSLQTFTGIIGTVLAAIAVGAWAGGRLADGWDPSRLLGPILMVGGILCVASPALVYVVGPSVAGDAPSTIVALAVIGFFLPAAVLSTVTPVAAKLSLHSLDSTGSVVGQLSAVGTVGALFGTFITGFVLIAAVPSQPITWIVGGVVVIFGVVLSIPWGRSIVLTGLSIFALAVMGSSAIASPCQYETAYSCAFVAERGEGETVKALILDTFVNSVVDTADPSFLASRYAHAIDAVIRSVDPAGPSRAVYVGGGGFALPRYYYARSGSAAVVLEIDGELPGIAERDLGLDVGPWLDVVEGDARISIRSLADDGFDFVVGDAFSGRSVPWHLTTAEFLADVSEILDEDGVYVMNLIDHPPLRFARSEIATVAAGFNHVVVVAPSDYLAGERGGNFVVAGSSRPFDAARIASLVIDGEAVIVDDDVRAWVADAGPLTDDFAPADQLLSRP